MNKKLYSIFLVVLSVAARPRAEEPYLEPGTLRLSHEILLDTVLHKLSPGWAVENNGLTKSHTETGPSHTPWEGEVGESLLTEVATRVTPDIFGRLLFKVQGDYGDRFWRPDNYDHYIDEHDRHISFQQAEAKIDKDDWFLHGFKGVGHADWGDKGDFFRLYPEAYGDEDYIGRSGYFGVYPDRFKQDYFLNVSKRHAPRGFEGGFNFMGLDVGAAYGNELSWGYDTAAYGRISAPIGATKLTFVAKNENVPWNIDPENDERDPAYALSWWAPSEAGHTFEVGVMYRPFRLNDPYQVARSVPGGTGLLGSSTSLSTKTTKKADAVAEKIRYEQQVTLGNRLVVASIEGINAGVVAGNKEQVELEVASDLWPVFSARVATAYRKPKEGPIPFLYEGTPDNIGAVAAQPRGPDDPFTVNWDNREAFFLTTTLIFDPTPGNALLTKDPDVLELWNVNSHESAPLCVAFQHRMRDYKTTTDRLFYINEDGKYVFDPPAHSGAWATDEPLQEFRLLFIGRPHAWRWALGIAGGQDVPYQSAAYSTDASRNKPITEYYSIEGQLGFGRLSFWAHYGTGVWAPEIYQAGFGESTDRLWGGGLSYNIARQTTVDVSYLAIRQDDQLFVAPNLGSYDEIRTLVSYRFGFLFEFQEPAKPGYQAR